jgi:hypothetical protein
MEKDKISLRAIQSKIRNAAEVGDMITVEVLVASRTELAQHAHSQVAELSRHIDYVSHIQDLRQRHLVNMLNKLHDLRLLFAEFCSDVEPVTPGASSNR